MQAGLSSTISPSRQKYRLFFLFSQCFSSFACHQLFFVTFISLSRFIGSAWKKVQAQNGKATTARNSNYAWCTRTYVPRPKNVPHFSLLPKLHFVCKMGKATRPCFRAIHQRALSLESRRDRKKKKRMRRGWQSRGVGEGSRERQFYLHSPSKEPSSSLPAIDKAQNKDSS